MEKRLRADEINVPFSGLIQNLAKIPSARNCDIIMDGSNLRPRIEGRVSSLLRTRGCAGNPCTAEIGLLQDYFDLGDIGEEGRLRWMTSQG